MGETEVAAVVTEQPEAPVLSITEHAAKYGAEGIKAEAEQAATETAEETAARHHSTEQRRTDTGQFDEGKKRVRPSKDFAQRIQKKDAELGTIREAKSTLEQTVAQLQAEVDRLKRSAAPAAQIATAEERVDAADPEPLEDDPKFGGDYTKFLKEQARWAARDALREDRANEAKARTARHEKDSAEEVIKGFGGRVEAAKEKYEDFEKIAFGPTRIPSGSPVDAFVMEDDNGPDVLYYLNQQDHAQELDEILSMSVVKQLSRLSALSARLSSPSSGSAVTSGSVPTRQKVELPPRPPNPLRTEAQRVTEPPPTDGSLSILKHAKAFQPRR